MAPGQVISGLPLSGAMRTLWMHRQGCLIPLAMSMTVTLPFSLGPALIGSDPPFLGRARFSMRGALPMRGRLSIMSPFFTFSSAPKA